MSTYLIIFMHDGEPAVRVVHSNSIVRASEAREMVATIYDDPDARVIALHPDHDDYEQLRADYAYAAGL